MKITVKVVTRSSQNKLEEVEPGKYKVWLHSAPEKGKANQELVGFLSRHFQVPKSEIKIEKGSASRVKAVEIDI